VVCTTEQRCGYDISSGLVRWFARWREVVCTTEQRRGYDISSGLVRWFARWRKLLSIITVRVNTVVCSRDQNHEVVIVFRGSCRGLQEGAAAEYRFCEATVLEVRSTYIINIYSLGQ
jgi:hypothetical protein